MSYHYGYKGIFFSYVMEPIRYIRRGAITSLVAGNAINEYDLYEKVGLNDVCKNGYHGEEYRGHEHGGGAYGLFYFLRERGVLSWGFQFRCGGFRRGDACFVLRVQKLFFIRVAQLWGFFGGGFTPGDVVFGLF